MKSEELQKQLLKEHARDMLELLFKEPAERKRKALTSDQQKILGHGFFPRAIQE